MQQILEIKDINDEDIKFLKKELNYGYKIWLFFSLFSIVFPCICIYQIFDNPEIIDKTIPLLAVIIIFGFWAYVTIGGFKSMIKEQQNLLLQKKIEGNIIVLEKEIITIKGHESNDSYSYELKIYSEIERIHKNISIDEKYYDKIQKGNLIWLEYFSDCNYIKTLIFEQQNIKNKTFTR
ncbi:hypothetical protein [Flavobacterium sp. PL02]|jgi:hypothetical protein|uniref:hypothetical protein n=1 Tax=Flavobacterium sp. PL02 TaxID=3088354 RepID=UPI002B2284FD|nr:hypothetical protein [Flavobacterium sp. PL02]MEA9412671.1 hypothetical protein [Flavobacterium sp. PL02]